MRLLLNLSANRTPVEFNHLHILAGALHKWLGPNEEHDGLSLYSFSWLQGAQAGAGGLHFPKGARWHISAVDGDFLARSIQGIFRDPGIRWGMEVKQCEIVAPPVFPDSGEVRFRCASPIFIKRSLPDGEEKHYLYTDPDSDRLLTETLQHKLRAAGLDDSGVSVRFDREYPKAKTQKVMYRDIGNMANYCPVFVRGTGEQLAFAWTVGMGGSTGVGFGGVYADGKVKDKTQMP
ncbi:MAG: CRISPR-associated endoribonuclease Cas6 [Saprospiraceae bacterium]|nr:CRISPR-associated endoribonuclease Cas6 [Lewinellaceae bacterium]